MLCGTLAPFFLMVRRNRMFRPVALCILINVPLVVYVATRGWRIGYYVPFYQFSFLGLAALVAFLADRLSVGCGCRQ